MTEEPSEFVIDAIFSLADELKSPIPDLEDVVDSVSKSLSQAVPIQAKPFLNQEKFKKLLNNSPLPIKQCKVEVNNFIESEVHNKITEACNNAIFKQEPEKETESLKSEVEQTNYENTAGRPSRKRKPNSMLLSDDYCLNQKEYNEFTKKCKTKIPRSVTCQIDHDFIVSVAKRCLPEVIDKSELKGDVKMVSILPPTINVNIGTTPVIIDWKEKVSIPDLHETTRPQTARTKKKLRTQEQIDQEKRESKKNKNKKPKPKCKQKNTSPDPSPPHLEPYGGQMANIHSRLTTPKSPDHLPPYLQPYEVGNSADSASKIVIGKKHNYKIVSPSETGKNVASVERIPLSLHGRLRKPNQQYEEYFVNMNKPQVKIISGKSSGQHEKISDTNLEDNESSTKGQQATKSEAPLLNTNVTYQSPQSTVVNATPQVTSSSITTSTAQNKRLTSAIGELAKIENTKKFFQLVVGDKVVLIPTNGDNVVPKAFVMDIAATRPGSHIASRPQANQQVRASAPQTNTSKTQTSNLQTPTICSQTQTVTIQRPIVRPSQPVLVSSSSSHTITQSISQPTSVVSSRGGQKQIIVFPKSGLKQEPIPPSKTSSQLSSLVTTIPRSTPIATQYNTKSMVKNAVTTVGNKPLILHNISPTSLGPRIQILPGPNDGTKLLTNASKGETIAPQSLLKNISFSTATTASTQQKILFPVVSNNKIISVKQPFPTYMIPNSCNNTIALAPSGLLTTTTASTCTSTPTATKVKAEPDNIKDYEKAAKSFKGVPDDGSETESDEETKSSQADRQSQKCKEHVPEVGIHVPVAESETSERIRKLKEKMRQQQLQVETLRKSLQVKTTENI